MITKKYYGNEKGVQHTPGQECASASVCVYAQPFRMQCKMENNVCCKGFFLRFIFFFLFISKSNNKNNKTWKNEHTNSNIRTHTHIKHKKEHEIQKENLHINYQPFIFYLLLATCHLALPALAHVCEWVSVCIKCTFYICCKPLQSNRYQTDWEWASQQANWLLSNQQQAHWYTLGWNALFCPIEKLPWISSNQEVLQHKLWYRCVWSKTNSIGLAWHKVDVVFIMCSACVSV